MNAAPTIAVELDRWAIVPNQHVVRGRPMPACHDHTPFVTIECTCGYGMHVHEAQLEGIAAGAELETRCHRCRKKLVLPVDLVRQAIAAAWEVR